MLAAATATALIAAAGCAQNYASTLPASGEPLAYDWSSFRQGNTPIDEHDYYRIAGDDDAATQIQRKRSSGIFYNRAGWWLAAIGLGGLFGATLIPDAGLRKVGYGLTIALPIGGTMVFYGRSKAERNPQLSGRRAREAANRYNAHLSTVGAAP